MALWALAHRRSPVLLEDELPEHNVVLFDPRLERSFESLLNRMRMQDFSRGGLDLLIVRGSHPGIVTEVENDEAFAEYMAGVPTVVLAGGHDAAAPAPVLLHPAWSAPGDLDLDPVALRRPELDAMLHRSTAIFHHEGCHYDLPSSAVHAERFIRLADALQDATDLVRISDWLLPLLGPDAGLVADTGTLLGLMAVVRDEALRRFGWDISIATLDEYPRSAEAVEDLINNFSVAGWRKLVFLISVNSTGAVARYVSAHHADARIIALCETAPSSEQRADRASDDAHIFVEHPVERWRVGEDRRCTQCGDLQLLHIHPETYEFTADLRWTPTGFAHEQLRAEKDFWAAADLTDAVDLHVDHALSSGAREDVRHLSVSLDIAALLTDPSFSARAQELLRGYPKPGVVLIPDHAATGALRQLAQSVWDIPVHSIPLGPITSPVREDVEVVSDVLIMDDVVITTQTLFGLRTAVYDVAREAQRDVRVWSFVVVARPPSLAIWKRLRQRYMADVGTGTRSLLACVQELELPPPGHANCPWCRERVLLQRTLGKLEEPALGRARRREEILRRTPLRPPLGLGGIEDHEVTVGAMIGELRPRAAFAAMVAQGQHIKNHLESRRRFAEIFYFNIELLLSAIFDAAMFGGILRTLDPRSVRDPAREIDLAACLADKDWTGGMLAELAIAAAEGKLPADGVLRYLEGEDSDGTLSMLRALAQRS